MNKQVLVIGANGHLGQMVVQDLLQNNAKVVTLTRKPFKVTNTTDIVGDPKNYDDVKKAATEVDAIISTVGAGSIDELIAIAINVAKVAAEIKVPLIWSAGAGTLIQKDGTRLIDQPQSNFPAPLAAAIFGHAKVKDLFPTIDDLNYVFVSPAFTLDLERPEHSFKLEVTDQVLYNKDDESIIGYLTQAKILVYLVDHYQDYLNKQITSVETD